MNRKNLLVGLVCGVFLIASGATWATNRFFFDPETLDVGMGSSFEYHMMMEIDEDCCGYGFNISAVVGGASIFDPDNLTFDWTGTGADLADFSTLLGPVYDPVNDYFGGTAAEAFCPDPKVINGPATYIAIKIFGTIDAAATEGYYALAGPHPGFTCQLNLLSGDVFVNCDTGYLHVIPYSLDLEVFDCPDPDSIPEGAPYVITATGTVSAPNALALDVTVDGGPLPPWANFETSGNIDGTLTLNPTLATGPWSGNFIFHLTDLVTQEERFDTCFVYVWDSSPRPAWLLEFKKTLAWPGQQHVCVPVFLSNEEPVNAFEILFDYDPTAVTFVSVSDICIGCDGIMVHACDEDDPDFFEMKWPLFDETYRPEYFTYTHGVGSHPNWVRVVGILDMDWPQPPTPPIPPGAQQMIFCVIVDVSPLWNGQEVSFRFHIKDCTDNTLADVTGYHLWGPMGDELPSWLDCNYDSVIVLWDGNDGCPAIGIKDILTGDLNCNEIQCEVGDAVVFINYLVYGQSALCQEQCDFDGCEAFQGSASDMNGDGYIWTIADLVALLNCVNGIITPPATASAGPIDVMVSNEDVTISSDVEIGGAYFTIEYEGDAIPELAVPGMDLKYSAEDGLMKVVIYSMDSERIASGTRTLFTLPGIKSIRKADLADGAGNVLNVSVFTKPPAGFAIQKIVPNPVRERTADIFFSIPTTAKASLKIYDAAGRVVTTIVDGVTKKGLQKVTWDARDFSNGVYFCRLESEHGTDTRKVVLMK